MRTSPDTSVSEIMDLITAQVMSHSWCKQVCQCLVMSLYILYLHTTHPPPSLLTHTLIHVPPPPSHTVPPSFLEEPSNVTAAFGDFIRLNCTATGAPLPTIVWEDGEGGNITDDEVYNITTVVAENVVSVLEFVVFDGVNGSGSVNRFQFRCVAENKAGQTESELATIITVGEQKDWLHVRKNIIKRIQLSCILLSLPLLQEFHSLLMPRWPTSPHKGFSSHGCLP